MSKKRKTLTESEKQLLKDCLSEKQVRDLLFEDFETWMFGQTCAVIGGKFYYYKWDVDRFRKGLPVIDGKERK